MFCLFVIHTISASNDVTSKVYNQSIMTFRIVDSFYSTNSPPPWLVVINKIYKCYFFYQFYLISFWILPSKCVLKREVSIMFTIYIFSLALCKLSLEDLMALFFCGMLHNTSPMHTQISLFVFKEPILGIHGGTFEIWFILRHGEGRL